MSKHSAVQIYCSATQCALTLSELVCWGTGSGERNSWKEGAASIIVTTLWLGGARWAGGEDSVATKEGSLQSPSSSNNPPISQLITQIRQSRPIPQNLHAFPQSLACRTWRTKPTRLQMSKKRHSNFVFKKKTKWREGGPKGVWSIITHCTFVHCTYPHFRCILPKASST